MDWVKIMCNILDHRKIKMIRKGPEGNTLVLLWLLMLTEAGKCRRGGYLMVSNRLQYTAETLSMVTDIPLPTVQLGLTIFSGLDMIDHQDEAIFIKNWGKYQSEDRLEARRENDRLRQQRRRMEERKKMITLSNSELLSRDSHVTPSRDVTLENRQEETRGEQTITNPVRKLLAGTSLAKISDQELTQLVKRHGLKRVLEVADVAAETWRRTGEDKRNPGGYLHSLCELLLVPGWYAPVAERNAQSELARHRKTREEEKQSALKVHEDEQSAAMNALWNSLAEDRREKYRALAAGKLPDGIVAPPAGIEAVAKSLAWESDLS